MGDFGKKQPLLPAIINKNLWKLLTGNMPWKKNWDVFCHSTNPHYSNLLWIILESIIFAINFYFAVMERKTILKLWKHNLRYWKYIFFKKLVLLLYFCQCFFFLLKYISYKQFFGEFWGFFFVPLLKESSIQKVASPWYIFSDSWVVL